MEFISLSIAVLIHYIINTLYLEDLHKFQLSTNLIFFSVCLTLKDVQFIPSCYRCSMLTHIYLESFIGSITLELFMVIFWTQAEIILNSICQRLLETDHLIDFCVFMISFLFLIYILKVSKCLENFVYYILRQTEN